MEPIIPPVSIHLLEEELTRERFVRYSSRGENKLFDVKFLLANQFKMKYLGEANYVLGI